MVQVTGLNFYNLTAAKSITFKGLDKPFFKQDQTYLLAFDLDGTFLECDKKSIEKFMEISSHKNVKLAYVTGRVIGELETIRNKYALKGINIPLPDYFFASNGLYMYEKKNGKMSSIPSEQWHNIISNTGFEKKKVKLAMNCFIEKNKINNKQMFLQFDYRPTQFNVEYLVSDKVLKNLEPRIMKHLKANGIESKFFYDYVPPADVKATLPLFPEDVQNKIKPLLDKDGGIMTFYLTAANKADAVEYLRNKLSVDKNHVVTAGNAGNDISMASKGYWFIMVHNAQKILKDFVKSLPPDIKDKIIQATKDGTAGINEALEKIFSKVGILNFN